MAQWHLNMLEREDKIRRNMFFWVFGVISLFSILFGIRIMQIDGTTYSTGIFPILFGFVFGAFAGGSIK